MSASHNSSPSLTRRLVYALALVPIVPSVAYIGATLGDEYFPQRWFDDQEWFLFLISTLCVTGTIAIWRSFVVWTLGRKWLTALISLVPFVQLVYAQPLWTGDGCVHDDIMNTGQHQLSIGVWVWLLVWVWWGWERIVMNQRSDTQRERGIRMPPAATKLVASIGLLPLIFGVFLLSGSALSDFVGVNDPVPQAMAFCAVVAVAAWVLIWHGTVVWTRHIRWWTITTALLFLGVPVLCQLLLWDELSGDFAQAILGTASILGWGIWMAVTVRFWRMKPEAFGGGSRTPRCLKCGYLLTGLRATRCPECGADPTIDELYAATSAQW